MNKNETVIVAAYADEATAEAAIENLREWDKRVRDVKLGVIAAMRKVDGVVNTEVVSSSLFNRSVPISDDALRVLSQEIGDRVAVIVACDNFEAGMVSDALVRAGGEILANTSSHSAEEAAKQEEDVKDALAEQALRAAAEEAKRGGQSTNRPL